MLDVGDWSSLTTTLVIGVCTLLLVQIWQTYRYLTTFSRMGIPGPRPLPLLGNMRHLLKYNFNDAFLVWEKEYGKVYGIFCSTPHLVVGDRELARDILVKKFNSFSEKPVLPGFGVGVMTESLLSAKGDHWKYIRSHLSPTFSSNKLKRIAPAIATVAQNLRKHLEKKAENEEMVELKELNKHVAMDVIAAAAFGLEVDSLGNPNDPFYIHSQNFINGFSKWWSIFTVFPSLEKVMAALGITAFPRADVQYLIGVIDAALEERQKDRKKYSDFLQLLLEAQETGSDPGQVDEEIDFRQQLKTSLASTRKGLTQGEVHANSLIFLFAGNETVSTVVSHTLFCLAAHEDCLRKAQREVDCKLGKGGLDYDTATSLTYLDMCMNETMRIFFNGMLTRVATEDVHLGEYHVPKGMPVLVPPAVFHFDPQDWPDPTIFDPERHAVTERANRDSLSFLSFGLGPRNCIGMRLAQMEIRLILASVLRHFTPVQCEKTVYPPKWVALKLRVKDGLWVKFKVREDVH